MVGADVGPAHSAADPALGADKAASPGGAAEADRCFIETQFPVSRLSKESYKERSAKNGQTLTPLGKWWGRKPLVMVRAIILGLLMPASADLRKDRDVFLALLTMDDEGLRRRKRRSIPLKEVYRRLSPRERVEWFLPDVDPDRPRLRRTMKAADRARLQRLVFDRLSYDEKLVWCDRPEQIDGPSKDAWIAINAHLDTKAASLADLVQELGERRFGRVPRVGDTFCGGGSVPFEAARLGCDAYGSDLNPVAALLTWGALNVIGGGETVGKQVRAAQTDVFGRGGPSGHSVGHRTRRRRLARRHLPLLHRDRLSRVRLARAACAELGHRGKDAHGRAPRTGAGGADIRHPGPLRCRPGGAGRRGRRGDGEAVATGMSQPRVRRVHPDGGHPR